MDETQAENNRLVLCVDDNPSVLSMFKRVLHKMPYDVVTHDIGKIVLDQYAHQDYLLVLASKGNRGKYDIGIERELINTDHARIGKQVAENWGLPEELCLAIGRHHSLGTGAKGTTTELLSAIADYISTRNNVPSVPNGKCQPCPSKALATLKVPGSVVKDIQEDFKQLRSEAEKLIKDI